MRLRVLSIPCISLFLAGCVGAGPFRQVQICVGNEQGVVALKSVIKSIANVHHMKYVDASKYNQKNLRDVGAEVKYQLVDVAAFSNDGMGMEAGNLGLTAYDISVGFSVGSRPGEARQFAQLVIGKLAEKWVIHPVPAGRGALPLEACRKKAAVLNKQIGRNK